MNTLRRDLPVSFPLLCTINNGIFFEGAVKVNMGRPLQSEKPGFAMAIVLLTIVILLAMGTGLLGLGLHSRIFAIRNASEIAAQCAADAGLAKAVFEMNEKLKVKPWDDSILPEATDESLPNCGATFSYTVTGDIDNGYIVESIGSYGRAEKRVSCTLPLQGPFEYAIFTVGGVELKNSATVDWYNYGDDEENLKVGTNSIGSGDISLKNSAIIKGDVVVGVGGEPDVVIDLGSSATITGETFTLTARYELTPVTVPEWLQLLPSGGTINDSTTITGSGKYDSIDLANAKTITIDGAVTLYIIGDITLNNSSQLKIVDADTNPDASLTLYLGGDYEGKNSSNVNNLTKDPRKLKIYGLESCSSMDFKNSVDFYGTIYATDADVIFYNSAEAFGAIIAKSFEQKNASTFYYDASLREGSVDDESAQFVVKGWSE